MKTSLEHLEEHAQTIRLTDAERFAMRAALVSEMRLTKQRATRPVVSPYASLFAWRPAFAALLILILAGGGTAFAAERALPGDSLYAVKVAVLEPAIGSFQTTPAAQAEWQVHLANERLSEAEAVAASPTLATSTRVELATRAAASSEQAAEDISALAATDPSAAGAAATSLDNAFSAHALGLAALTTSADASATPVLAAALSSTAASATESQPTFALNTPQPATAPVMAPAAGAVTPSATISPSTGTVSTMSAMAPVPVTMSAKVAVVAKPATATTTDATTSTSSGQASATTAAKASFNRASALFAKTRSLARVKAKLEAQ